MLARDPGYRPSAEDAAREVLTASPAFVTSTHARASSGAVPRGSGITGKESSVRSALLVEAAPYLAVEGHDELIPSISSRMGGELTHLSAGKWLIAFGRRESATDLACIAASCALEIRARVPSALMAIATGTSELGRDVPIGEIIDRVATSFATAAPGGIALDETTAALLPVHFEITRHEGKTTLDRVVAFDDEPRTLLGVKTPCVGRERELATLETLLDACTEESASCAAFVEGDAGAGKTRLRQEFVARAKKRHPGLTVLVARGELVGGGSPRAVARQLVRAGAGVSEVMADSEANDRIRKTVEDLPIAAQEDRRRIGDFLGLLLGLEQLDPPSAQLEACRDDERLAAAWLRRSFMDWLGALAATTPIVVVVDDLQWADATSTAWIAELLRQRPEARILVLGLGRPDLREQTKAFRGRQEIQLLGLRPRAAEELIRSVVPDMDAASVRRVVERSQGNAFYVEELTRHLASGGKDLPPTVLAMAHSRLERLEASARLALRAASVLGERFWLAGAEAILGDQEADVARWLEVLATDELVARVAQGRFSTTPEFVFRHALLREAAYASLTESDRATAHLRAARFLESAGEANPLVMIEHFEKAGEARLAIRWYSAAADAAQHSGDMRASEEFARRGLATYADGEPRDGGLLVTLAGALGSLSKLVEARAFTLEALDRVSPGTDDWLKAVGGLANVCLALGDGVTPRPWLARLTSMTDELAPSTGLGWCLYMSFAELMLSGQPKLAHQAMVQFDRVVRNTRNLSTGFEGWHRLTRGLRAMFAPEYASEGYGEACEAFRILDARRKSHDSAGDGSASSVFDVDVARFLICHHATLLGELQTGRKKISELQATTPFLQALLAEPAVLVAVASGDLAAAEACARPALQSVNLYSFVWTRTLLAIAFADGGNDDKATSLLAEIPPVAERMLCLQVDVHLARSRVALGKGDAHGALTECELGDHAAREWGGLVRTRQLLVLTRAEALRCLGRLEEATEVLAIVRREVDAIASTLDDDARQTYLTHGFSAAKIVLATTTWGQDANPDRSFD
jgi:hypothetical protein